MRAYKHKVNYYETDRMGVTHHSNYIRFMEEARVDFLEQIGWGYDKMEAEGIVSPVVNVSCDFKKTTTFADVIEIQIKVEKISAFKLILDYTMTMNGDVACTAQSSHCFLDTNGKPVVIEKKYPEMYKKLQEYLK